MNKEEAIRYAECLKNNYTVDLDKLPEFCDMAISALSADGEYIKKEDILNELGDINMDILTDEVKEIVNGLPSCSFPDSAENKGEWIPVSERLPKDGQSVLFCDIDEDIMIGYHVKGRPESHFSQDGTYEDMKNVIAWMPLPSPWKGE